MTLSVGAVMALKVLHAGDGYQYLMRQVATGDLPRHGRDPLASYYLAEGNPPGQWIGSGCADLGVAGEVREDQMQALFGERLHPEANVLVSAAVASGARVEEAIRSVRLGRALASYDNDVPLLHDLTAAYARFAEENGRRPDIAERRALKEETARHLLARTRPGEPTQAQVRTFLVDELGRVRQPVSGFDLVFSQPTKTGDLLWALGDHRVRVAVEQAHHEAVRTAIAYLEREAAFSRVGKAGIAQVDTHGLIATAFTHRESRAGDPNLHTHVALANAVRCTDGRWRTLDSRQLHRVAVSASEVYNAAWERGITRRLNVRWVVEHRGDHRPIRHIAGLPTEWIEGFSRRRRQVESVYDRLVADHVARYGTTPTRSVQLRLAQQAAVTDRPAKEHPVPLRDRLSEWAARARALRPDLDIATVLHHAVNTAPVPSGPVPDLDRLAAQAVDVVSTTRATWTVYHVRAEVERSLRGLPTGPETRHHSLVDDITDRALRRHSLRLDLDPGPVPVGLRRADGESVFRRHDDARHTSQAILDAEQRLLHAARAHAGPAVAPAVADAVITRLERRTVLDPDQRALVHAFTTSGKALSVAIGPPGSGKSTALRAVATAWTTTGGKVIGLAPSATAAAVLGQMLGIHADTLHRLVHTHDHGLPTPVRQGDMLLVDEAGMAGTRLLDRLRHIAEEHGAVVRLVGDHRQLGAVETGGALRLLHNETGGVELTHLHRFTNPDEAHAVLAVRRGDRDAANWYSTNDRLHGGPEPAVLDRLYTDWLADREAGRTSIMSSDTNTVTAALSARAQSDLRTKGIVEPTGVPLHDGNQAGQGDLVVTRLNRRDLRIARGDHVKNGDLWTVLNRNPDGSLKVRHHVHHRTTTLPADYVARHVELGYAATIHRTQGITVEVNRAHLSRHATRELAAVATSRGTTENHLYLPTDHIIPLDEPPLLPGDLFHRHHETQAAHRVLTTILNHDTTEKSATEQLREAQDHPFSLDTRIPEYEHALRLHAGHPDPEDWLHTAVPHLADTILTDPAHPALLDVLAELADHGHNPATALVQAAADRELHTARSTAQVLHHRLTKTLEQLPHTTSASNPYFPCWLTPPPDTTDNPELHAWLHTTADAITYRVRTLAHYAATTRPPWTASLGDPTTDPDTWLRNAGQIAAYRERWTIPDTDPTYPAPPGQGTRHRAHTQLTLYLTTTTDRLARLRQRVQLLDQPVQQAQVTTPARHWASPTIGPKVW
ncbi:hypothetical protein GCM10022243_25350 [Saccharothrix violaceirubra]|uniref:Conjugative relaxase-like TrwC/TraI family protein n=1 Tax=Saccharothrix violaceirubra TaxID=413306 RepID=A0A7W7WTU3_9PSEU|nr:MobF family relaxase [Saccharothrix violaceirubra]MBB4963545.1 conjugative relaxase-like TrwC/TraI family protein [Saccharothrix violaceirubra]